MKLIGNLTGKLQACVTALILVSFLTGVQAQTFKQGSAKVAQIKGKAQYSAGGNVWVPLKTGTTLKPGSFVKTAPESIVDLNLGVNGPLVRVAPNSTVSLDKLAYAETGADTVIETRLSVENGTIIGNVKKLAKASKYEIKTPNGVAGIRGTDYAVTVKKLANGDYEITFNDITGTLVVVASVNGEIKSVVLNANESWTVGSDVRPLPPETLEFYKAQIAQLLNIPVGSLQIVPGAPLIEQYVSPTVGAPNDSQGGNQVFTRPAK
jgi:hypothetical protein